MFDDKIIILHYIFLKYRQLALSLYTLIVFNYI